MGLCRTARDKADSHSTYVSLPSEICDIRQKLQGRPYSFIFPKCKYSNKFVNTIGVAIKPWDPTLPRLPYPLGVPPTPTPGYVPYPMFWIYPQNPDKNHVFHPRVNIGKIPLKYGFSLPPFGYLISG